MRAVPDGWLVLHVDHPDEWPEVVRRATATPAVRGVHAYGDDIEQVWGWFRSGYRFVQAAGGAVTDGQGRLLAIHRLGRWDLPKGKVDPGESMEEAAVREVQEECGLAQVELVKHLYSSWHTYERKGKQHLKRTDWFLMKADMNEVLAPQTEEDIDAVKWIDTEEMTEVKRDTYASILPVITAWEEALRDRA